jgi:hypothetical protein
MQEEATGRDPSYTDRTSRISTRQRQAGDTKHIDDGAIVGRNKKKKRQRAKQKKLVT